MTKEEIKAAQTFIGDITKALDTIAKGVNQIARQTKGPLQSDLLHVRDWVADVSNCLLNQALILEAGGGWTDKPIKLELADKPGDVTLKGEAFIPKLHQN